jgi:hypothetical protein
MTTPHDDDRVERSRRYPSITIREAVAALELLHRSVGFGGGSRETLAHAIGHSSLNGTSKRKIAALTQYGLLDRDGERYRISDLGRRIIIPISEREKAEAIAEAARRPQLFQAIGSAFDQQQIPSMLANLLAREYGVVAQASTEVANLFVQTAEQAGLIVEGVLNWSDARPEQSRQETQAVEGKETLTADTNRPAADIGVSEMSHGVVQDYSIPLDNKGRKARIHLPTPVSVRDLDRLRGWVDYMRNVIDDVGAAGD